MAEDDPAPTAQRLDKWLWFARVVKSRTLAAALVGDGRVRVNRERVEKPSQTVRPGDVVTVAVHRNVRVLKVLAPGVRRGPPVEARMLWEDLSPPPPPDSARGGQGAHAERAPGSGRPTKRDRRRTDRLKDEES